MIALKENEPLASSVGIDVTRYLVLAAVVSAAIAGGAGSLYAHYLKIIDPDIFLFIYTVTMVIMVITGGKGTLAGPIVGGLIFGFLPVMLRPFAAPDRAVDPLRRADDPDRVRSAARDRAGGANAGAAGWMQRRRVTARSAATPVMPADASANVASRLSTSPCISAGLSLFPT